MCTDAGLWQTVYKKSFEGVMLGRLNIVQRGQQGIGLHLAQPQAGMEAQLPSPSWRRLSFHWMLVTHSVVEQLSVSRDQEHPFLHDS